VADVDPALAANPLYVGAQAAVTGAALAGKTASALGQSNSIESVGRSLKDAYAGYKQMKTGPTQADPQPAPGAETLTTAASQE
jgi:hypothetical protein